MKCRVCGEEIRQIYYKDVQTTMNEHQMCYDCNFWRKKLEQNAQQPPHKVAIIDGVHYYIDDENVVSSFRGFGGDKFVIHFNDGTEVVTTNLWCQGDIPPQWRDKFPDNAKFDWEWKKIGNCNYLVPKETEEILDELISQAKTLIGM